MADRIDSLTEDVQDMRRTVDHLSASVDERFTAVDVAIREQREYTEFAYTRLEGQIARVDTKMDARFGRLERKLDTVINARPARRRPKRGH